MQSPAKSLGTSQKCTSEGRCGRASIWRLIGTSVTYRSRVIRRKLESLHPGRAVTSSSESGRSGFYPPSRAALARLKRACCENFMYEMERDLVWISFVFPFLCNLCAHLTGIRG